MVTYLKSGTYLSGPIKITSGVGGQPAVFSPSGGGGPVGDPLTITGAMPQGAVGISYLFVPTVSGGSGTRSFTLAGSLPGGLSFTSSTGAISGTPTTQGTTSGLSITVTDSTGSAVLPAQSLVINAAPASQYMFAATRLVPPTRIGTPGADQLSRLSRVYFYTPEYALTELRLVYQNTSLDPQGTATPEVDPGNALTIEGSSIEIAGTFYRVTFNGGSNTVTIPDGGVVVSDALAIAIPAMTQCWVRTIDTVASLGLSRPGGIDRTNGTVNPNTEGLEHNASSATLLPKIMSGSVGVVNGTGGTNALYCYAPTCIVGKGAYDGRPVVLIHGDSMMSPANDTAVWADQYGCFGWGPRGLYDNTAGAQRLPHSNMALFGSRPSDRSTRAPGKYRRTGEMFDAIKAVNGGQVPFTAVLSEHINNDASAGITGTALLSIMQTWWNFMKSEYPAARVIQTAAMPATTDTSGQNRWTTIAGQSFRTTDANWPPVNAASIPGSRWWVSTTYIATLQGNVDAVIDQTSYLSGTDYGKWKVPAFTAALTSASAANASVLVMDNAPEVGEALVVEPDTANFTGPGAFFVRSVAGSGPYNVTMFTSSVNAHASGSVVKSASCADGVHGSPRLHMRLAGAIIDAKAAGKFGSSGPAVPVNTALPSTSGGTTVGSTRTATTGTWTNSPSSFTYQWTRNGSNIGGETASTYLTVLADDGNDVACVVIAINGAGSSVPTSSPAVTIGTGGSVNFARSDIDFASTTNNFAQS